MNLTCTRCYQHPCCCREFINPFNPCPQTYPFPQGMPITAPPLTRLQKAKAENERLKQLKADKLQEALESSEAEKLEKENEKLAKELGVGEPVAVAKVKKGKK